MSTADEFATVDLVLGSTAETRGVDAFALSLIKAERQIRKLFTYLVFQDPAFGPADVPALRNALGSSRRVYFDGFLAGFDALYRRSVEDLVGAEHARLKGRLKEAIDHRNKIFHGQLTARALTRNELVDLVTDIKAWCARLAASASAEFDYDGFDRNSFHKSAIPDLSARFKTPVRTVAEYETFIRNHLER